MESTYWFGHRDVARWEDACNEAYVYDRGSFMTMNRVHLPFCPPYLLIASSLIVTSCLYVIRYKHTPLSRNRGYQIFLIFHLSHFLVFKLVDMWPV